MELYLYFIKWHIVIIANVSINWCWFSYRCAINHIEPLLLRTQILPSNEVIKWSLYLHYIPRNMHTVFALLCFVVVIHWLIFPYPSGLLHWHCGNLTIAPVPAEQPWWIWINTSCEFIMNDCITTTKQSTTKPCAYFLGYTVGSPILFISWRHDIKIFSVWTDKFPSQKTSNAELWSSLCY